MKIRGLQTFIVNVPYREPEVSARVRRKGVTDVVVRLTTDDGLIGWGESCSGADAASVEQAVRAAEPFVVGRDPWETEAIARDYFHRGLWDFRAQTGQFALAGIDQALWDLCGKSCGQPLYRLFGGPMRGEVDYFYYLSRGGVEHVERQCADGVRRGYTCFYLKVGIDWRAEEVMLAAIRRVIGAERKIRIDANEAWNVPEAVRLLRRWDASYGIDFCEAPVQAVPAAGMREVRDRTGVCLSANEGLGRPADVVHMIRERGADVLCFSSYWVGTLHRFLTLCRVAALDGLSVCKHTHGELGIAAAAQHHVMLAVPNVCDGCQQTAQHMDEDVLADSLPIATGPRWGRIEHPGLGVEVDEERVREYHARYLREGQYLPYAAEPKPRPDATPPR